VRGIPDSQVVGIPWHYNQDSGFRVVMVVWPVSIVGLPERHQRCGEPLGSPPVRSKQVSAGDRPAAALAYLMYQHCNVKASLFSPLFSRQ